MASSEFQQGTILKIKLTNFVTYDEVVVKPGRNLNLILGANGTGKSTIVSAIVLGLGGNPKVIGRATQIGHYVKAGQTKATISIDLQNSVNKFITVTRTFDTENHSSWMINDKSATNKDIANLMQMFNIQVDNLCQFLPQDKVQDFSNLSPKDLLIETERSVGHPKLLEYHQKLIELRANQATLEKELSNKAQLQNQTKQTYDSLKDAVSHSNEQKKIKLHLKTLKQKKAWMIYQSKKEEFTQAKKGRDEAKTKMEKIQKKLKPIEQEISKLKGTVQTLEKTAREHNSELSARTVKLNKFLDEIERCEKSIDDNQVECENEVKEEQKRDENINNLQQQKHIMENDLAKLLDDFGAVENIKHELENATAKMNEHKHVANNLEQERKLYKEKIDNKNRQIQYEEQNLQAVENIENKRMEVLQRVSNDAYRGVLWLRQNMHLFSKTVHEPMLLNINLKHGDYSKYFENIISIRDLTAFVCEDKNDMNLLIKYLRDQQKLKVNVIHSDPNMQVDYEPNIPIENIQQYGFEHYLVSLIEAPRTIMNVLVSMYRINNIPIGNEKVSTIIDRLPNSINRFFTPSNSYGVSCSKYTGEKSTRQAAISSRGLLSITIDTARMEYIKNSITNLTQERDKLMQEIPNVNEKIANLNKKIEQLREIRKNLQENLNKLQNLEMRINVIHRNIQTHQNNRKNIEDIRLQYKTTIQNMILRQIQLYKQYNKLLDECFQTVMTNEEVKLQTKLAKNNLATKENDTRDLQDEYENAERSYRTLDNDLKPIKAEVKTAYDEAKASTDGLDYNDPNFTPIKNAFSKLTPSLPGLIEEITSTQARLFCITNNQQDADKILEQFNTAKKRLATLEEMIKQQGEELDKVTEEINALKDRWFELLNALVDKINNNFSTYFTKMKCAGEISLIHDENSMDFDKYGLQIKVKFRDSDQLQPLTRNHQSGGERAVTTAVYMIALQELTRVPFRCVDEINQGMDATNERRVFELIVDITSKTNSSQYFLLTPKLLPNLKYSKSVTVLTVFNGKFMVPCSQFDIQDNFRSILDVIAKRQAAAH